MYMPKCFQTQLTLSTWCINHIITKPHILNTNQLLHQSESILQCDNYEKANSLTSGCKHFPKCSQLLSPFAKRAVAVCCCLLFSCPVLPHSLQPHGLQHTWPPCPPPPPRFCPSSRSLHWWCHPTTSIFVIWCEQTTHWKSPWCWERLKTEDSRRWDGWVATSYCVLEKKKKNIYNCAKITLWKKFHVLSFQGGEGKKPKSQQTK